MKINLVVVLFLSVISLTTTVRAQSSDEIAIRKTLDGIRLVFEKHDLNAFSGFFKKSPDLYYQIITIDHQVIQAYGYDNMKKMIGGYFQSVPVAATPSPYKTTDSRIRISGDTALVTEGNDVNGDLSLHLVALEKIAGIWKITAFSGQSYKPGSLIDVK
ncbi:nuclear transport factor 2 family protein [Spirosoma aerophilum]